MTIRSSSRLFAALAAALVFSAAPLGALGAPAADPAPSPKALILGDTSYGSEGSAATAAGFDVTVVNSATWRAMTQADFAAYRVLIFGDPSCGPVNQTVFDTAATWGPVVMGQAQHSLAGNRIVIGTDPVFHGRPGGGKLISDGIKFAGSVPNTTGLYFNTTCDGYEHNDGLVPLLQQLSSGSGSWSENTNPPCGGNVGQVATHPSFSDLSSTELAGWGCSVHETFPTFTNDWFPLFVATDTDSHPTCGTDPATGQTVCGEAYVLIAGQGVVANSANIALNPTETTLNVGQTFTITATITQPAPPPAASDVTGAPASSAVSTVPVVGAVIEFAVTGVNNGAIGTCSPNDGNGHCITDANGQVTASYAGVNQGDDTVTASYTDKGTKQQATSLVHWTAAAPPQIVLSSTETHQQVGTPFTLGANVSYPGTASGTVSVKATSTSGTPVAGQAITFTISGVNSGTAGTCSPVDCKTDSSGNVSFTYTGYAVGDDTVSVALASAATAPASSPVRAAADAATALIHWECTSATVIIDAPAANAKFKVGTVVSFTGHWSDHGTTIPTAASGGSVPARTARWVLTCNKKANCTGTILGTADELGNITAYFKFPRTAAATYTAQLIADDGCGGTTSAGPITFTVKIK